MKKSFEELKNILQRIDPSLDEGNIDSVIMGLCAFAEEILRLYKASQEIRTVDEIVPELSMKVAGELVGNCDYAFAVSDVQEKDPDAPLINWADAESFYYAGYEEARKRLKSAKVLLHVIPEMSGK